MNIVTKLCILQDQIMNITGTKLYKQAFTQNLSVDLATFHTRERATQHSHSAAINLENPETRKHISQYLNHGLNPVTTIGTRDVVDTNTNVYPTLNNIIDTVGLAQCQSVLMCQYPGMYQLRHTDKLATYGDADPDTLMRLMIFLTPQTCGQFLQWGDECITEAQSGDLLVWDWTSVPHATANASDEARVMLRLTGIITEKTTDFFNKISIDIV